MSSENTKSVEDTSKQERCGLSKKEAGAAFPAKLYTTEGQKSSEKTKDELDIEDPARAQEIFEELLNKNKEKTNGASK